MIDIGYWESWKTEFRQTSSHVISLVVCAWGCCLCFFKVFQNLYPEMGIGATLF